MSLIVTATDVKNYLFCPYIAWARRRLGIEEPVTPSMGAGRRVDPLGVAKALGLPEPHRANVRLYDKSLGASGVVDVIAGPNNNINVLEVKAFRRPPALSKHFVAQLLFYALLVSRSLSRPRAAHLWLGGDVISLRVGIDELRRAESLIGEVRRALESDLPPRGRPSPNKCASCWYRSVCPYAAKPMGEVRYTQKPLELVA